MRDGAGFIAALDQSGGSTPKALKLYGIDEEFLVERRRDVRPHARHAHPHHQEPELQRRPGARRDPVREDDGPRRSTGSAPATTCGRRRTSSRSSRSTRASRTEADGVQLMKPMPGLDDLLERGVGQEDLRHQGAVRHQAGRPQGRRRRSRSSSSTSAGRSSATGSCPSSSPRSTSRAPQKAEAEALLKPELLEGLDTLPDGQRDHVQAHPARDRRLLPGARGPPEGRPGRRPLRRLHPRRSQRPPRRNPGVVASFSRALTEGLSRPAERRRVRRHARRGDRAASTRPLPPEPEHQRKAPASPGMRAPSRQCLRRPSI